MVHGQDIALFGFGRVAHNPPVSIRAIRSSDRANVSPVSALLPAPPIRVFGDSLITLIVSRNFHMLPSAGNRENAYFIAFFAESGQFSPANLLSSRFTARQGQSGQRDFRLTVR